MPAVLIFFAVNLLHAFYHERIVFTGDFAITHLFMRSLFFTMRSMVQDQLAMEEVLHYPSFRHTTSFPHNIHRLSNYAKTFRVLRVSTYRKYRAKSKLFDFDTLLTDESKYI